MLIMSAVMSIAASAAAITIKLSSVSGIGYFLHRVSVIQTEFTKGKLSIRGADLSLIEAYRHRVKEERSGR